MIRKNIITRLSLAALVFSASASYAQDIHFTQFDMQPLVINPAFTGMFNGKVRVDAIYRSQWNSVTVGYKTYGASVDMPIKVERNGDYLAGGLQLFKDVAGDGNLSNFTGLVSIAYHKTFGGSSLNGASKDLAVGLQGGYAQQSIDLSKLYFADEFVNGSFVPGTTQEYSLGLGNSVNYYLVNAGISYAQSVSDKFSYVLGVAANNLNQPNQSLSKKQSSETSLDMRYTGELGLVLNVSEKLSLRPAVLYQYQASASEIVAGNEFHYALTSGNASESTTGVFLGGWYRSGDATMITGGIEFANFRVGLAYDYNISTLNSASNGNGGFEIALKYISPYHHSVNSHAVPCNRF